MKSKYHDGGRKKTIERHILYRYEKSQVEIISISMSYIQNRCLRYLQVI